MTDLHAKSVVIIGKAGRGKSTLGNLLLGEKKFAVGKEIPSTSAGDVSVGSGASLPKTRRVANSTALSLVQSQGSSSVRLNSSTIHRRKEKFTNDTKEKELLSNVGSLFKEGKTSKEPTVGVHTHRTPPKEITSGSIEPARQPIQEKKVSTPQTTQAQVALRERPSHTIKVLDTFDVTGPGVTDSDIDQEVKKWKHLASHSPDAFLLTVRADVGHAVEDFLLYQKVKEVWGNASEFRKKLIVVFTFADNLANPDEDLRERAPEIRELLKDADGRHILISDKNHMMAKEAAEKVIDFVTGKAETFGKKLTLTCKDPSAIQEDTCTAHDEKEETLNRMSTLTCKAPSATQEDAHNAHDDRDSLNETDCRTDEQDIVRREASPMSQSSSNERRVLIIGKKNSGKRSLRKLLDGKIQPDAGTDMPTKGIWDKTKRDTEVLRVVETPDVMDDEMSEEDMHQHICCLKEDVSSSPDVILYAVRCDPRHTVEDFQMCQRIKNLWGEASDFHQKLIVALIFAESLDEPQTVLSKSQPEIQKLLEDVNGRYILISDNDIATAETVSDRLLSVITGKTQPAKMQCPPASKEDAERKGEEAVPERRTSAEDERQPDERRVLIVGKTGNGKSTLGNLLLGTEQFRVATGMSAATTQVQTGRRAAKEGTALKVVDTPDLINQEMGEADRRCHVNQWKTETLSNPDAILLAVRCDVRYTSEEFKLYQKIKELWGDASQFCQKLIVAFTFGETLDKDIHEVLKDVGPELQHVLGDAGNRFVVFSKDDPKMTETAISKVLRFTGGEEAVPERRTSAEDERQPDEIRVLIVGKTGNGKSTLGNLLLGTEQFRVATGMSAATTQVQTGRRAAKEGTALKVVDTPDLINLEMGEADRRCHVNQWKTETLSNPDAILLAVRCDVRYTSEEFKLYQKIKELWGDASQFCHKLIVAFTFGETLDEDIHEVLKDVGPELQHVLGDAGNRCVVFSKDDPKMTETAISKVLRFTGGEEAVPERRTSAEDERQPDERRVLIVGKTGNGKSTLGNLLLGTEQFRVATGMSAATTQVQTGRRAAKEGTALKVVDTPDLMDQKMSEADMRCQVNQWKTETLSNPDVIMVAVCCDGRYTSEEYKLYQKIKELWGDASQFCQKLIVAFTFGETLDKDIHEVLKDVGPELQHVLGDAGNRCVVFSKDDPKMTETAISKVLRFTGASLGLMGKCIQHDGIEEGNASGTYQETSVINPTQREKTHQMQD